MLEYNGKTYRELRCSYCRALLGEEYVYSGRLRIKCWRCGEINSINFKSTRGLLENLKEGKSELSLGKEEL